MAKPERLDKILAHMGVGSRSEIRRLAKQGALTVNGHAAKDPGMKINTDVDQLKVNEQDIIYKPFIYLMMNKPQGVISATEDKRDRTVIDLLSEGERHYEPFPVGRLDKDTEGLLLLTNDGKLSHNLLSPKKHVPKTYYAKVEGHVGGEDVHAFSRGVTLDDGYVTMGARLRVLSVDLERSSPCSEIELTIMEGKFHQVKRMFQAVGKEVVYLKRISMGSLKLDEHLTLGAYRELTAEELEALQGKLNGESEQD
ncbi:hypothetical protein SY83_20525 [Paenibacillus swuensis]|uniref:Pseudouridine synthase n=1 Tax=Paenibacillus swuensis TaxID=1178515 RepID=A0A172TMT2_9BACL|nr:pseudouridine synthase [Paenibacillus swuensis]ANE48276.1 hypothetical protein SY83_20525 [Paenibacillus swuensis]